MRPRVLVADDEPSVLHAILRMLGGHGIAATGARSGREALSVAAAIAPAVFLLDAVIPDIHGFEICRRLKAMDATRNSAVLILTGQARDDASYAKALGAGARELLWKPFDPATLVRKTQALLDEAGPALPLTRALPATPVHALLVEDDESSRHFWTMALAAQGFTLDHAITAEAGLALCRRSPPDVGLVDMTLPGRMDGLAFCRALRDSGAPDARGMPVMVLSALERDKHLGAALAAGADDFLPKSIDPAVAAALLRSRLARVGLSSTSRGVRRGASYLEVASRRFYADGALPVELSPQAALVLKRLMESFLPCSADVLADAAAVEAADPCRRRHRVQDIVRQLRAALPGGEGRIVTATGDGYRWLD